MTLVLGLGRDEDLGAAARNRPSRDGDLAALLRSSGREGDLLQPWRSRTGILERRLLAVSFWIGLEGAESGRWIAPGVLGRRNSKLLLFCS